MKKITSFLLTLLLFSCASKSQHNITLQPSSNFIIAFGSCNDQNRENNLWGDILKNKPNVWVWGGDNIYADTDDMQKMESDYLKVKASDGYKKILENTNVLGTWDDHDYGINDGGVEFIKKDTAQQLFLNFFNVATNDLRRKQQGIYHSRLFTVRDESIKIIVLDTRYFRTQLTKDPSGKKRYIPNLTNHGTILGETQWNWLENELKSSTATFNIIVTSIQFLSREHGWETWGTMPNEITKMQNLIVSSKAKGVLFISGDRHISEISKSDLDGLDYPLFDVTSSGLTHTYEDFISEPNQYRVSKVISKKNFGVLKFNLHLNTLTIELRGLGNELLESMVQQY